MALLELRDVEAGYLRGVKVLQGVSLHVDPGEVVCLIGPNGAGKSTVLRTVSGLLRPTWGQITFDGRSIGGLRPDVILRLGVAHVPQGHSAFPGMSVHENLLLGAYSVKDRRERQRRLERTYGLFPLLAERRNERAGNLSGGQQKILEIGRALMMTPRMMLLDEPSMGLAPRMAKLVFDTIRRLNEEAGVTVLMVEQNARSALSIAHRGYVLELGTVALEAPAASLLADPRVAELYLGGRIGARAEAPGERAKLP
ncbi:MAG TPA: ABC transporter ATP-binding protein [Actinomycetota bacterium]|nr:ABC transporter ATP-binding protein [Actinomycetota bacterium]